MQLDFSSDGVVTDKKSSWILIYQNSDTDIYTEKDGVIKTKWNLGALLKWGYFNIGRAFWKGGPGSS